MATRQGHRYNFFVAVHITYGELLDELVKVQKEIINVYPDYAAFKTPRNGFHLTLAVMKLESTEDEQTCVRVMDTVKNDIKLKTSFTGPLKYSGIRSFSPKVVFVHVECPKTFLDMVASIKDSLRQAGIQTEDRPFNAHLTLFNVKHSKLRELDLPRKLELGSLGGKEVGAQRVEDIHVCRMGPIQSLPTEFCYRSIWSFHK